MQVTGRKCENCGLGMLPWVPRKRGPDGKLWCRNCHEGRPGRPRAQASLARDGEALDGLTPTTVEAVLAMEAESERQEAAEDILAAIGQAGAPRAIQTEAYPYRDDVPDQTCPECNKPVQPWSLEDHMRNSHGKTASEMVVVAHDSGDGQTIFHCPFCGGGQVVGRSDGTTECAFCGTAFTVQVQPLMSAMPQTAYGQPVDMPGMPDGGTDPTAPFNQDAAGETPQSAAVEQAMGDGAADAFQPPGGAPGAAGAPGDAFVPPQKAAALQTEAGRSPCPGSNAEPLPSSERHGSRYTQITPTFGQHHESGYGVCPTCQEPKKLLASGKLPKHTRYLSWKDQQEGKQGFFIGPEGVAMPHESYIRHLALRFADDREAVLTDIRESNLA